MRKLIRVCWYVTFLPIISACVSSPALVHKTELAESEVCCVSFQDFKFDPIFFDSQMEVRFSSVDPIHNFPQGKSPFKAYKLAAVSPGAFINIQTDATGGIDLPSSYWFYPVVTFLDKNKVSLATHDAAHLVTRGNGYFSDNIILELNAPVLDQAEYFVVHTTSFALLHGINFSRSGTAVAMIGGTPVPMTTSSSATTQFSPYGKALISLISTKNGRPDKYDRKPPYIGAIVRLPEE